MSYFVRSVMALDSGSGKDERNLRIDPKYARKIVGSVGPGAGRNDYGSSTGPSEPISETGELLVGLGDLYGEYGERARKFVFEGETYRLLRTGHDGQVSRIILPATHLTPRNISLATDSNKLWWEEMRELHNGRTDRSNNFFIIGFAFLNKEPLKEVGLSIRRAMTSWINKALQERYYDAYGIQREIVGGELIPGGFNDEARALRSYLEEYLNETFGVQSMEVESQKKKGLTGFFGARENVKVPKEKKYDTTKYPSVVGTELRFYYGQNIAQKNLTQRDLASRSATRPTTEKGMVVLRREDLDLDRPR